MKIIDFIKNKLNIKTKKRNNILFRPKKTTSFRKKRKKFNFFKTKFNFREISLSDYYNKNNDHIYYFFVGFILIFLSIYAFLFSDYFNVKKILIFEKKVINKSIIDKDFASRKIDNFRYKNIFFIDKLKIKNILKKYQNSIKKVEVDRLFPSTLKITVYPYKPVFRTFLQNKNFIILKNGTVVPSSYKGKLLNIEVFSKKIEDGKNIEYKKIFEVKYLAYIKYIYENIKNNISKLKIYSVRYFPIEREVHIVFDNNIILIFSLESNLKEQLENFLIFKNTRNKEFLDSYYIDLRISKRVFFCPKKNIIQCKKNLEYIYDLKEKDLVVKNKQTKEKNKK